MSSKRQILKDRNKEKPKSLEQSLRGRTADAEMFINYPGKKREQIQKHRGLAWKDCSLSESERPWQATLVVNNMCHRCQILPQPPSTSMYMYIVQINGCCLRRRHTDLASLIIDSHKCDFIIIRTLILGVKARKLNFIRWTNVVYHLLTFYYVVKTFKTIFYQGQSLKQYICCCCRILKVAPIGFGILQ